MYIVDTNKLEKVLEQMSKRIETLEKAIRYMGEEFTSTNARIDELKDMLSGTGDVLRHSGERMDAIAYDVNEALCAIDEMRTLEDDGRNILHIGDITVPDKKETAVSRE